MSASTDIDTSEGRALSLDRVRRPAAEVLAAGDPEGCVRVVALLHPFENSRVLLDLPAGLTLAEMMAQAYAGQRQSRLAQTVIATIEGDPVPRDLWARVRPKPGTMVTFRPVPQGGGIGRIIFTIFIAIAAAVAAFYLGPLVGPLIHIGAQFAGALIGAAVTIVGTLLLNALFPIRPPKLAGPEAAEAPVFSIGGIRNEADPFGPVPVLLGTMRIYPKFGAKPYTEILGDEQFLRALFIWGYGPLDIAELKLGETPLDSFDDVELEHGYGYASDPAPTLFPAAVFQEELSVALTFEADWQQRTTAPNVDEISVDIVGPNGIFAVGREKGNRYPYSVAIQVQYRAVGSGTWLLWTTLVITSKEQKILRRGLRRTVARGQYDVRLRKSTPTYEGGDVVSEDIVWSALRGFRNDPPIRFAKPVAWTVIRIRASEQLNAVIETLNGICTSRVTAWNGSAWVPDTPSNKPADLYRWVCQMAANARPLADAQIDLAGLQDWHAYCEGEGFTFNMYRDFRSSVLDTLADIASAGRAAVSIVDGRQGVIWDQPTAPIVQHFTPRNAWGFSGKRSYKHFPHGFRVRFINEEQGYLQDERIVYDDGYDELNATRFEGMEFPGVTKPELIWKHGRFQIAQARLRPELFTLNVDFENLVCTRGDRVRVSYDVPLFGLQAGRVKAVSAELPQQVTLDEIITQAPGGMYAVRFRLADGSSLLRSVTTTAGESPVLQLTGNGELPEPGDLAMFGEAERETVVLRVYAVEHLEDFAARLTLVDDAPAISEADQGAIPPYDSQITIPPDPFALPPQDLRVREYVYIGENGVPREAAEVSWTVSRFGVIRSFEVEISDGNLAGPWAPVGTVAAPQTTIQARDLDDGSYFFRVRALFADGTGSAWTAAGPFALLELLTPPPDVQNFRISVLGQTATLTWDKVSSIALSHYRIRFSPLTTGATWGNAVSLLDNISATSIQIPAQRGTYLIKAVEIQGRESVNATAIATNIAVLTGNVVETIAEDPDWAGTMEGVVYDPTLFGIRLAEIPAGSSGSGGSGDSSGGGAALSEGTYWFDNAIDLGDVFTSRLSVEMLAFGLTLDDDFFEVVDFFDPADFFRFDPTAWAVTLEVRFTNDDPTGSDPLWSDWQEFAVSDYTARAFEFRLHLASGEPGLTPLVTAIAITVDMPDRVEAEEDLVVPVTGLRVDFTPPFIALRGVAFGEQDLASGDRRSVTNKDETGFDIVILDAANNPVERTFDYVAKGYGRRVTP